MEGLIGFYKQEVEMSVDSKFYIGPYIQVSGKITKGCKDNCKYPLACSATEKGYCSKCGIKIADRFEDIEIESIIYDDVFDFEEKMNSSIRNVYFEFKAKHEFAYVFIPNLSDWYDNQSRKISLNTYDKIIEDWISIDPIQETNKFRIEFEKEISMLKSKFGNVAVKWGLLQWCD